MDLLKSPLMSALVARLEFLAARTGVIAANIANADTPDYVARDIKAPDFQKFMETPALKVSSPRHIAEARSAAVASSRAEPAPDPDAALNGNKVSIETQMMKLSQTRMDYQLASTVYRKGIELIRLAARGGR
jgi:flagellar basal-body rod protein FlgB